MGHKFTLMVEDEEFSKSINIAKWNIYMTALADCVFYTFSYLISEIAILYSGIFFEILFLG